MLVASEFPYHKVLVFLALLVLLDADLFAINEALAQFAPVFGLGLPVGGHRASLPENQ